MTNDPTGVRRLAKAIEVVRQTEKGYGELLEAAAAVRVAELERVVEAATRVPNTALRNKEGFWMVNQGCYTEVVEALSALDAKETP